VTSDALRVTRNRANARRAFTLVELLIVIGIISILAALLFPALRAAIYQARLVSCMSMQRQWGVAVTAYAGDYRQWYPRRTVNESGYNPQMLCMSCNPYDDRPKLMPYLGARMMCYCPLNPVPFDVLTIQGYDTVCAGFELWFGSEIARGTRSSGLLRVGERARWIFNGATYEFDTLTADIDYSLPSRPYQLSSHPDSLGLLPQGRQDLPPMWVWAGFSSWDSTGTVRGTIDRNFLHGDLSVRLIPRVGNNFGTEIYDPRFIPVPAIPTSTNYSFCYLPPAR
jgi:prepilin-type N-terminal cleavage/methylation domain-containing protein